MKMGTDRQTTSWWREAGVEVTREELGEGKHLWQIVIRLWVRTFYLRWER